MILRHKNIFIQVSPSRKLSLDVFFEDDFIKKPLIIYTHGFKGFKDWGNFDLIAENFARQGYAFLKFNLSCGGLSLSSFEDFDQPELFGSNNASKELEDLQAVIDWVKELPFPDIFQQIDSSHLILIGHSRGGGSTLIKAHENTVVKKAITWASISDFNHIWRNFTEQEMIDWRINGVAYTVNSRTGQKLPLFYQLYEDYLHNTPRLAILNTAQKLCKPLLICHGTMDEAVPVTEAERLHSVVATSQFYKVEGANHVFGRKHPWTTDQLPADTQNIIDRSIAFLREAI